MALACPIDPDQPLNLLGHDLVLRSSPGRHDAHHPLYWRSRRDLPLDLRRGRPRRGTGPPQVLEAQGAIGCSRRVGPVRPVYSIDQPANEMKGTGVNREPMKCLNLMLLRAGLETG